MLLASSLCYSTRAVPDYTVLSCASEDALARGTACTGPASKGLRQGGGGARDRPRVRDGRSKTIATATRLDRVATASVHQVEGVSSAVRVTPCCWCPCAEACGGRAVCQYYYCHTGEAGAPRSAFIFMMILNARARVHRHVLARSRTHGRGLAIGNLPSSK